LLDIIYPIDLPYSGKRKMIIRKAILLVVLLFAAACSGNEVTSPTEAVAELEQAAPAVVEATDTPEQAQTETTPAEPAAPALTPDASAAVQAASPDVAEQAAVAPEAAAPETDAVIVCDGKLTPANPEGPFYTPNTPERTSLIEEGMAGDPILLAGRVLTADCEPVAGAMVDFWQTDAAGEYDNVGYRLRGHQFTDESGRYTLETIIPGQYPGRPAHIHVKIFSPDGRELLTSQLYIPGISEDVPDGFFDRALLVRLVSLGDGGQQGIFDFVVP
jgi:protocatechuate 3,4-dioxygenase beta subunit